MLVIRFVVWLCFRNIFFLFVFLSCTCWKSEVNGMPKIKPGQSSTVETKIISYSWLFSRTSKIGNIHVYTGFLLSTDVDWLAEYFQYFFLQFSTKCSILYPSVPTFFFLSSVLINFLFIPPMTKSSPASISQQLPKISAHLWIFKQSQTVPWFSPTSATQNAIDFQLFLVPTKD